MNKRIDKVCRHDYYIDRTVTIKGVKHHVWRCKHCGDEYYQKA